MAIQAIETHQAQQALENLKHIVEAAGCSLNQVVAVDVFLTDRGTFLTGSGIYEAFIDGHKPVRAVVEVSALPKGGCVEIKCIVYG